MTRSTCFVIACMLCLSLASCTGTPSTQEDQPLEESEQLPEPAPIDEEAPTPDLPGETEAFDPSTIPREVYDSTKNDVQTLIEEINGIIRDKDFNTWVSYLGINYRKALSDEAFLKRVSESSVIKKQKITLRTLEDYFTYVVVPSRTKDRVDDIEFIGQNRVKAFTVNAKGKRLRLYDLEKTANGWKIVD